MRSRSLGVFLLMVSCALASLGSAEWALADGFQCEHSGGGPQPALLCQYSGSEPSPLNASVTLRKMPAWDTHAGLTIIDVCSHVDPSDRKDDEVHFAFGDPSVVSHPSGRGAGFCKRRYCTDKKRSFLLMLNSVPVPVGWSVVSFRLGKKNQSFSIACDEFRESIAEVEGEQQ
jgi:hypothetical protein